MKRIFLAFCFLQLNLCAQSDKVWMHPNKGQWDSRIKYKIELNDGEMLVEQNGFTYQFHNISRLRHHDNEKKQDPSELKFVNHVIKTNFIGSNAGHTAEIAKPAEFYRNYFIGNEPSKWKSGIYPVSEVRYPEFYPGIDMLLESGVGQLKYTFSLQPNVDPGQIKFKIEGATKILLNKTGELRISHTYGDIIESKPIAWTIDDAGKRTEVEAEFKLSNGTVSYHFPSGYDHSQKLVIDPNISFSTYTGSTADNWGCTATPDAQGNLFAGGTVFGIGYPLSAGALDASYNGGEITTFGGGGTMPGFDISLSKFNATGTALIYSTYIGGTGNECPNSMIADANGELYIMGVTSSANFPGTNGTSYDGVFNTGIDRLIDGELRFTGTDIYVVHLNATGTAVLNATYVGGTNNDGINLGSSSSMTDGDLVFNYGDCFRGEIILDNVGNVLVASSTNSGNFPTVNASQTFLNGTQDAVIFKLNPNLSTLLWSTYYGGSGFDTGYSLQVNTLNEVYLTGGTLSPNLLVPGAESAAFLGGAADGYLVRFNSSSGTIINGTYIGTASYDQSFFVQIDIYDFVYVYGQSFGPMTITPGTFGNPNAFQFIRKYEQNLSAIIWNTKVGGGPFGGQNQRISPTAFLVSKCSEIYFAGWGGSLTSSNISSFPVTADAFQNSTDGDSFYICVLDPDATGMQYATFIGGSSMDHVDGGTSRFDKNGKIYHAVCSSCGFTNNGFVTTPGVYGPTDNGPNCNLAAFKFDLNSIIAIVTDPVTLICIPHEALFFNNSIFGDMFFWDFGDNGSSNEENPSHLYTQPGEYTVKLVVSDSLNCYTPDSVSFTVTVAAYVPGTVDPPPTICENIPYQFNATGGTSYLWSPPEFLDDPTLEDPVATISETTDFSVIITTTCAADTVQMTLEVFDDNIFVSNDTSVCLGHPMQISVFNAASQIWTPNSFINNNLSANPIVSPVNTTDYIVTATSINGCVYQDTVNVEVFFNLPTPDLIDSAIICFGKNKDLVATGAPIYTWSPNQFINTINGSIVNVNPPVDIWYYCDFTNACGTLTDSVFIEVIKPNILAYNDTIICLGESVELRAEGGKSYVWSPVGTLSSSFDSIVTATPKYSTDYLVIGTDLYGCKDSVTVFVELFPVHPVDAGPDVSASIGELVQLNASSQFEGDYIWSPYPFLSCSFCHNPVASPNYNFDYTVYFKDINGCLTSDMVQINYKGVIYVPNSFTPDENRFNQVFKAYGEGIVTVQILIFDRWGELICTLNSMDEYWDGTYNGKMCQDDTYTWKMTYSDITGQYKTLTGHINLLR